MKHRTRANSHQRPATACMLASACDLYAHGIRVNAHASMRMRDAFAFPWRVPSKFACFITRLAAKPLRKHNHNLSQSRSSCTYDEIRSRRVPRGWVRRVSPFWNPRPRRLHVDGQSQRHPPGCAHRFYPAGLHCAAFHPFCSG